MPVTKKTLKKAKGQLISSYPKSNSRIRLIEQFKKKKLIDKVEESSLID